MKTADIVIALNKKSIELLQALQNEGYEFPDIAYIANKMQRIVIACTENPKESAEDVIEVIKDEFLKEEKDGSIN